MKPAMSCRAEQSYKVDVHEAGFNTVNPVAEILGGGKYGHVGSLKRDPTSVQKTIDLDN